MTVMLLSPASLGGAQQTAATRDIVIAANAFLASLDTDQRQKVVYAFHDAAQRVRWSNFPTGVIPRGGVSLKEMNAAQQYAAMKLLSTVLSPMGFKKMNEIREADDDFKINRSKRGPDGNGRNVPPPNRLAGANSREDLFGGELYFISFLGTPSPIDPWILQFGGHHLALNVTVVGSRGVLTPSLTGAQPAIFSLNGQTIRPLGRESDKALALLKALDAQQRKPAVLPFTVADLVLGPGQDDKELAPEGLKASAMNSSQQAMLLDLIAEWAGITNESFAAARMLQIKADLSETWFAWSGPTSGEAGSNIAAYYRIQGPHLVIEYAPQKDEPTNHVHTIYRDPENDFGRALTKP